MVKRYKPIKWSTERSGEEMAEPDDLPSAIAAIMDEDLEFETPPEYSSLEGGLGLQRVLSIPGEEEEFFSLYPISLAQQQYGFPPPSLESQDSIGPYYSLKPSQIAADQFTRLSSQDQQPKSFGGTLQHLHSMSVQPASLALNRMQSSNIGGVRRVLQNMANAITRELHLD